MMAEKGAKMTQCVAKPKNGQNLGTKQIWKPCNLCNYPVVK